MHCIFITAAIDARPRTSQRRHDMAAGQSPERATLIHPDMQCRVFIILAMTRSDIKAMKSKISYAECGAFRRSQRATLIHPDMQCRVFIILTMTRSGN